MLAIIANNTYRPFLVYPDRLERLVYLLIFLFPIAGMSVRHWISNIFILLVLIGLFTIRNKREPLIKEEKYFIWICVAYMSSFIISALLNGWGKPQTHYLGTELRFIYIIPVFLLVRNYADCTKWLLRGAIIAGFFLIAQACYDVYVLKLGHASGIYSKNIIGPYSIIVSFWVLYYAWSHRRRLSIAKFYILAASIISALMAAGMSASRGAYLGFIIGSLFCTILFAKSRWMFISMTGTIVIAVTMYLNIANVQQGVDIANQNIVDYFNADNHVVDKSSKTSEGVRLEMWRTSWLFLRDHFLFGVGSGNYLDNAKIYIENGDINPAVANYENPHNAFMEAATAKGIIGFITLLLLLYYPAYIYIRDYKTQKHTSVIGLIHIIIISTFSLTDHSVIVKNNYTAILLLGTAIFFTSHLRKIRGTQ